VSLNYNKNGKKCKEKKRTHQTERKHNALPTTHIPQKRKRKLGETSTEVEERIMQLPKRAKIN
jgi:hypothetical protein